MIAGIIVTAVGDELVIAHPGEQLSGPELATVAGGPALYLLGHVGFRLRMARSLSGKRLTAALACCAAGDRLRHARARHGHARPRHPHRADRGRDIAGSRRRAQGLPSPIEQVQERLEGERSLSGAP